MLGLRRRGRRRRGKGRRSARSPGTAAPGRSKAGSEGGGCCVAPRGKGRAGPPPAEAKTASRASEVQVLAKLNNKPNKICDAGQLTPQTQRHTSKCLLRQYFYFCNDVLILASTFPNSPDFITSSAEEMYGLFLVALEKRLKSFLNSHHL